ncbi:flagellar basal body rod protein FlgC [Amorphus orientalis]|uniref:Flagellar basal-body rod protein FlgC n=1 Tax=Amorphus orientalis TaxID=649198 RepID=A0AAE4ATS8_9HYPH|nr:flagellar basal body rod protein FlgC [Amorphus orientalis]MDQ0317591.1 flagellar basal-body rod protein FlgC [Amorphus orientalis]
MIDPLTSIGRLAGAGLEAQSARLRIVAENLANAQSTGSTQGADPYSRKTILFESKFDAALGAERVRVDAIVNDDDTPFRIEYDPGHPAADADGNVKLPNVNMLMEMADMREATRSYEANLQMMKQARSMVSMTIDLLRGS